MSAARPAPDRRTILGGSLALASAVAASAAPALAETVAHLDAEVLRLALSFDACSQRMDDIADRQVDLQASRFQEPPVPEALLWRGMDHHAIGFASHRLDQVTIDGRKQYAFTPPDTLDFLRTELAEQEARGINNSFYGAGRVDRLRELIAAGETWQAEHTAAWEAAGLGDLDRASDREVVILNNLLQRIAAAPALTADGVLAKVRVLARLSGRSMARAEAKGLPALLSKADRDQDDDEEMLLLSMMLDSARLAAPAASVEAA